MSIINLQNVMPAQELLKKWRRNKDWLETFIMEGRITAYTFKGRDSHGVHVDDYYHGGYLWQDNVAIVFDPDEIERIEREHPEVLASPSPPSPALAPPKAAWPAPKAPPLPSHFPAGSTPSRAFAEAQGRIAELERQLAEALQGKASKTAPGLEAAQASRVEEWKGYAVVMAKIAYDCGLEDRKQVTRSGYNQIAKRHGGLSPTALELLRGALPDGVTKRTGGPSSQG